MHLTPQSEAAKKTGSWRMEFEESTHAKILRLFREGKSKKEIGVEANRDVSVISRHLKQARQQEEI